MVLPDTDATEPRTGAGFGAGAGEPGGAGVVELGPEPCPAGLAGQAPFTEGLTFTDAAVTGWPPWAGWVGRTVTQLPEVTSVSAAGVVSVTLVVEVKLTAAVELSSLVTRMELPATDAIRPLTRASPLAGAGDVVVEVTTEVDVEVDVVGVALLDELHAATDNAATPVTARIANRVRRGVGQLADINVSPIMVGPNGMVITRRSCS
ncbi:hypothetical protein [Mycobacterium sp. 852002-30065_SCH5024008]|uniref:hypothetical protein n=1 Tax=Mycobacterium sp. 852002-30065_SCH5024008 TaxID=1834088 RepID=UPI001E2DCDF2|nr:hypothetical protein [Mycobacterium sp. 852002-30065_SCH5024008]